MHQPTGHSSHTHDAPACKRRGVYVSDALEDPTSDYCLRLGPGLSMDAGV